MNTRLLGDIAVINPTMRGIEASQDCSFVPMECVDELSGQITRTLSRKVAQVNKGYTPFRNCDVLFAKITPCMENGKCAIAQNLTNGIGFGSTEFHVIRAGDEIIPEWIYYYLRRKDVRQQAEHRMTGSAGQKRVPSSFLEDELEIPLPLLPEQRRIVAILARADRLRRLRRTALELSDSYLQSVFVQIFGDALTNPKRWPIHPLGELLLLEPHIGTIVPAQRYRRSTLCSCWRVGRLAYQPEAV